MMVPESTLENSTCTGGLLLVIFVLALCSQRQGRQRASKDETLSSSLSSPSPQNERCCAICLEQMRAHEEPTSLDSSKTLKSLKLKVELCRLPCGHVFHHACLSRWFKVQETCPYRCDAGSCDSRNSQRAQVEVDRTEREGRREESDAWCFVTSAERCRAARAAYRRCLGL